MIERLEGESERNHALFMTYVRLGRGRTYRDVAAASGLSLSSIERYGRRYAWRERAASADVEQLLSLSSASDDTSTRLVALRERQLRLAEELTERAARALLAYDDLWRPLEALAVLNTARELLADLELAPAPELTVNVHYIDDAGD